MSSRLYVLGRKKASPFKERWLLPQAKDGEVIKESNLSVSRSLDSSP